MTEGFPPSPVIIDAQTLRRIVREEMNDVLMTVGMDTADGRETRADMAHLRRWRRSMEAVQDVGLATAVKYIIIAIFGLIVIGFGVKLGIQ